MLSSFRNRFGTAGLVVAIVALVAALAGGAYAASGALTGKQKKEVKAIAKSFQDTGSTGPQGRAGADGKNGAQGPQGATGPTGPKGAKGGFGLSGAAGEPGPTGSTGPTGTFGGSDLPTGVTETGFWAFSVGGTKTIKDGDGVPVLIGTSLVRVPLSYPVKIQAGVYKPRFQTEADFATTCGTGEGGAGGTLGNPKAPPGTLCVFAQALTNVTFESICSNNACGASTSNNTGSYIKFSTNAEGPASGVGTWAITGA